MTIREAFEDLHIYALRGDRATDSTIAYYRSAIACWATIGSPGVAVGKIRQSHLMAWRANMLDAGYSVHTFDGYWRSIRAILSTCLVEGDIDDMPRTPRLHRSDMSPKDRPTPDQFAELYLAADAARWPKCHVPAPVVWRTWLGLAYVTGLRRDDILGLEWSVIKTDGIGLVPKKTRRYKKWVFCPNVAGVIDALLAPFRGHGDRVFEGLPRNFSKLGETQRQLSKLSGVPADLATFQPLRRASTDAWTMAHPMAGGLIQGSGIKMPTITRRHYVSQEAERAKIKEIMLKAAGEFPLPDCLRVNHGKAV